MNHQLKYILALLALLLGSSLAKADSAYEAQFNHSVKRWLQAIEYYRPVSKPMGLVYLCKNIEARNRLASEFSNHKQLKVEEKVLGYEARLVVFHFEKPSQENQLPWLRRNFYIGIAYHCDMDGFQ